MGGMCDVLLLRENLDVASIGWCADRDLCRLV